MTAPPLRRYVVEVDEEHALAAAVLGSCKQIVDVSEPGLAGERRREVGELDRNDRVDLDLAGWQRVAASGLDMRAYPDPYAARDLPAAHAIAELLGELHNGPTFARSPASRWEQRWSVREVAASGRDRLVVRQPPHGQTAENVPGEHLAQQVSDTVAR